MKSAIKKYLFMLSIICIAVTCIATIGYADFIFNTDDVSNGIGDSNNPITQTADPIRQNAVFGEAGDASASGTQYYDVYFMAQSVPNGAQDTDNDGNLDVYYYMDIPNDYSGDEPNVDGKTHYGAFYGENGESLSDDITLNENRYFKKIENVAELSINQIEQIGQPRTNNIFDSQSYGNRTTNSSHMYGLYFLCWTTDAYPIYSLVENSDTVVSWPLNEVGSVRESNPGSTTSPKYNISSITQENGYDTNSSLAVQGYYPSRNSNFSALYTNTLLSIYDDPIGPGQNENTDGDAVFLINGKKTIFIYPIYTSGKDYISQDINSGNYSRNNLVDSVVLGKYDSNNNLVGSKTFVYDDAMSSSDLDYYVLSDVVFEENSTSDNYYGNFNYNIIVDRTIVGNEWTWDGTKYLITNSGENNTRNPVSDDQLRNSFGENAFNVGTSSGRYNIYLISKKGSRWERDSISNDDVLNIQTVFKNNNITIYYEQNLDSMCSSYSLIHGYKNSRDYYIVYERIYEPRLIGGSTGSIDYRQNTDYVFTRVSPTGVEKNHYILRNVYLDPQGITDFDYTNNSGTSYKGTIKNNEFAIQLLPEDGMNYNQNIVNEPSNLNENNIPSGWPTLTVSDQNGADNVYPYKSSSILTKSTSKPKLVQTRDTNAGLYNLYIKVEYETNLDGKMAPSSIEVYAYQFNDIFINVYDGGEESIVYYDKDDNTTNLDETGYIKSSACEWRMINLKLGSNLTYDTPLTHYRENETGVWELIEEADGTAETKSLGSYLEELNANNSCLKELVTGKYITLDNYQEFIIDKNYAFVKCLKP